jgi:hypothetical protein
MQSINLNKKVEVLQGLNLVLQIQLTNNNGLVKARLNNQAKEITLAKFEGYQDANKVWHFNLNTNPGLNIWDEAVKESRG